jgi:hypothetical protein
LNTSQLIEALAADAPGPQVSIAKRVVVALAVGGAVSFAFFLALVGFRADIAEAMTTVRFQLKYLDAVALAIPAAALCWRLARPDAKAGLLIAGLVTPLVLLAVAVAVELSVVPSDQWMAKMIGHNMRHCLTVIPLLSIPPLAALIFALREGAPANPALSGALAGAAAAGLSAMIYATNCTDDSPLFVASWYPVATLVVMGVGALAGRRFLSW